MNLVETAKRGPYAYTKLWNQARKKAGLSDFCFHDLSHEAVSRLVEAGLSDQEVAAISGHKSMQMLKRCTHLRVEDLVVKMDKVFSGYAGIGIDHLDCVIQLAW